jgi:hypothetical protein
MVAPGDPRWEAHFRFASRVEEAAPVWLPPTILAFCIWCFWAGGNARALNAAGLLPRVVLVIGMLTCLPIQSYMYLDDLWRSSDPYAIEHPGSWREAPHSWWVRSWGLLCLSSALSTCGVIASDRNAVHPEFESWFAMAACLSIAAASGVLILIVLWIGIRQRMRFARIYGADVE